MYLKTIVYSEHGTIEDVYSDVKKIKVVKKKLAYVVALGEDGFSLVDLDHPFKNPKTKEVDVRLFSVEEPLCYKTPALEVDIDDISTFEGVADSIIDVIIMTVLFNDGTSKLLHGQAGSFYLMDNTGKTISKY